MREIKFRAWDKEENRWLTGKECEEQLHFNWPVQNNTYILLENVKFSWPFSKLILVFYTGLKDKNGREIYEEDIIRIKAHMVDAIEKVVFRNAAFRLSMGGQVIDWRDIEVLGNVYENPELLNES